MATKPPTNQPVVFLTPKEVGQLMRISQGFVYRMIKKGLLPHCKVGAHYRIHVKDLRVLNPNYVPE